MQLSRLRVYQGVPIFNKTLTYFDMNKREFKNWSFTYNPEMGWAEIVAPNLEVVCIPPGNISFLTPLKLDGSENKEASRRIGEAGKTKARTT